MIIFLSDFDLKGSGYMNIALALCEQLVLHGKKVTALGIGYTGEEHNWPFSLIPVIRQMWVQHSFAMINNLVALGESGVNDEVEAVVIALDIPLQIHMQSSQKQNVPYIGIFPVEDGPVCQTWAHGLSPLDAKLVISEHGKNMLTDAGVKCEHIRIGLNTDAWRMPVEGERKKLREAMGYKDEDFVVITVADNQERKNLSATMEIIARARETYNRIHWLVVTRKESPAGWKLDDLALIHGMTGNMILYDRGLSFADLWRFMAMADLFLLTSKAEGLGFPIVEAMAVGTPVLASRTSAILEHIYDDPDRIRNPREDDTSNHNVGERGHTIPIEYVHTDVWGNSNRSFVSISEGANILSELISRGEDLVRSERISRAREYAEGRNWAEAGQLLNDTISKLITQFKTAKTPIDTPGIPEGVPQAVPVLATITDESEAYNGSEKQEKKPKQKGEGEKAETTDERETKSSAPDEGASEQASD